MVGLTSIYGRLIESYDRSVIRLFHKELEAYLVAEGLFEDCVTEDGKCTIYLVWSWIPYDIEIFC